MVMRSRRLKHVVRMSDAISGLYPLSTVYRSLHAGDGTTCPPLGAPDTSHSRESIRTGSPGFRFAHPGYSLSSPGRPLLAEAGLHPGYKLRATARSARCVLDRCFEALWV